MRAVHAFFWRATERLRIHWPERQPLRLRLQQLLRRYPLSHPLSHHPLRRQMQVLGTRGTGHIRFGRALAVCAAGACAHLILDLTNVYGVKLLWPFAQRWYAWDLAASIDPLLLILLAGGLLLPWVFRLAGEEIGSRTRRESQWPAFVLLAMVALYFGVRVVSHARVLAVVNSRLYAGEKPLRAAALPEWWPLTWRAVVETDASIRELPVTPWVRRNFRSGPRQRFFQAGRITCFASRQKQHYRARIPRIRSLSAGQGRKHLHRHAGDYPGYALSAGRRGAGRDGRNRIECGNENNARNVAVRNGGSASDGGARRNAGQLAGFGFLRLRVSEDHSHSQITHQHSRDSCHRNQQFVVRNVKQRWPAIADGQQAFAKEPDAACNRHRQHKRAQRHLEGARCEDKQLKRRGRRQDCSHQQCRKPFRSIQRLTRAAWRLLSPCESVCFPLRTTKNSAVQPASEPSVVIAA